MGEQDYLSTLPQPAPPPERPPWAVQLKWGVGRKIVAVRRRPLMSELFMLVDGMVMDPVRDHTLIYGAAVAFYTLLSLIPLLILFASFGGFLLHYMGGGDPTEVDELVGEVLLQLKRAIPFMGTNLETDLRLIIANRGGLGLIGLLTLLLSASQVFRALEFAFARIFARGRYHRRFVPDERTSPRNIVLSKLLFAVFLLSLVAVFLVFRVALRVIGQLTSVLQLPGSSLFDDPLGGDSILAHGLSALIVVVGFWALIRVFAHRRVRGRYSLLGGVIFAAVWQVSRYFFEVYLNNWAQLGALYGSFSALMASVLWIFFTALLLLICTHGVWSMERRARYGPRYGRYWRSKENAELAERERLALAEDLQTPEEVAADEAEMEAT
jgi:membrane protein